MAELTKGQRVITRALALMRNKGYGWSKAVELAAQTLEETQPKPHRSLPNNAH